jgi:hypothetical protein
LIIESVKKDRLETKEHRLATKIALEKMKSEIIKWMLIFWIGQIAVTLALVYFKSQEILNCNRQASTLC